MLNFKHIGTVLFALKLWIFTSMGIWRTKFGRLGQYCKFLEE